MWISIVRRYVGLVVVLERLQYVLLSVEFAVIVMIYAIYGYSICVDRQAIYWRHVGN